MSLTQGTRLGHYEVIGPLGKGGMGEVYLAQDVRLGHRVALKVLPAAAVRESDRHGVVIDHFHLLKVGERWSIVSKLWDAEQG